jgi:hypothetical protein
MRYDNNNTLYYLPLGHISFNRTFILVAITFFFPKIFSQLLLVSPSPYYFKDIRSYYNSTTEGGPPKIDMLLQK